MGALCKSCRGIHGLVGDLQFSCHAARLRAEARYGEQLHEARGPVVQGVGQLNAMRGRF